MSEADKAVLVHANWRAALNGEETRGAYEVPLFTDAPIEYTGPITYGPYQFFHLGFVSVQNRICGPRIMVRVEDYSSNYLPGLPHEARLAWVATFDTVPEKQKRRIKKDDERYHGGGLADEVAALLSLSLGIRLKPGGVSRLFINHQRIPLPEHMRDERGRPTARQYDKNPVFLQSFHTPVIPHAVERASFEANMLETLYTLKPADVTALVRAARLYQDGLWMAEAVPEWTWLKLVSAVETAANHWRSEKESSIDRLRASPGFQRLVEILESHGGEALVAQVAPELMEYVGNTKKFVDFILTFLPIAPTTRPHESGQLVWDESNIARAMRTIYGYRSQTSHSGKAFPSLMAQPPEKPQDWDVLPEKPVWLTVERFEAAWDAKDMPLLLHTFEHIVRHALCKWWESMVPKSQPKEIGINPMPMPLAAK